MKRLYILIVIDKDGKEILRKEYKYMMALGNNTMRNYPNGKLEFEVKKQETIYTIRL